MIKIIAVITAFLNVFLSCTPFSFLFRDKKTGHRYIIIQDADDEATIDFIKKTYGDINPDNEILYAMGVCGPMLLTDSPEIMAAKADNAFELAVKYDVPVWFQIDDVNNIYSAYGEQFVTCEKWYANPENVEKLAFGEDAPLAPYWFNWGSWQTTPAMPCLNSPSFIEFIRSQLNSGFIPVLEKWLPELKSQNKEYLFAGVCVGWETRIPDYSDIPVGTEDQNGRLITEAERSETGFRALENLGYTAEKLKSEAEKQGISEKLLMYRLLSGVIHDYSEMISKMIFDAGADKTKIFTHITVNENRITTDGNLNFNNPEVAAAINEWSTPGFTVGVSPSVKRVCAIKSALAKADPSCRSFGAVEGYAAGYTESKREAKNYFNMLFNSGAAVVAVYGIKDPVSSPFYVPREYDNPFNQAVRELVKR